MATLQLLNCNYLNNKYENTIDFKDLETQTSYFDELVFNNLDLGDDYVYIREHNAVSVEFAKETLEGINYLRFRNTSKWWYAFIVAKDYVNENCTLITFEIDVMQTFMFDYTILKSLIRREHQDRFKFGSELTAERIFNTQKEDLDYGENYELVSDRIIYPTPYQNANEILMVNHVYFLSVTASPDFFKFSGSYNWETPLRTVIFPFIFKPSLTISGEQFTLSINYGGTTYKCLSLEDIFNKFIKGNDNVYSAVIEPYMPISNITSDETGITLYIPSSVPFYTVSNGDITTYGLGTPETRLPYRIGTLQNETILPADLEQTLSIENAPDMQLESKLYTNPYYYYLISDNNNEPKLIKNEYLKYGLIQFEHLSSSEGIIKDRTSIDGYKLDSVTDANQFLRINNCEMPLLSNAWVNYFNNNKATIQSGIAMSVQQGAVHSLAGALGIALGNTFGGIGIVEGIGSTIMNIEKTLVKRQDIKQTPDSIRSVGNSAQYFLHTNKVYFEFFAYSITDEYKSILFEFFQRYGYACNQIKVPDLKTRYYYNFIQTVGAIVKSDIDDEYITKIKNVLDNGITFWHYRDKATFKGVNNYEFENVEMSALQYIEENKE